MYRLCHDVCVLSLQYHNERHLMIFDDRIHGRPAAYHKTCPTTHACIAMMCSYFLSSSMATKSANALHVLAAVTMGMSRSLIVHCPATAECHLNICTTWQVLQFGSTWHVSLNFSTEARWCPYLRCQGHHGLCCGACSALAVQHTYNAGQYISAQRFHKAVQSRTSPADHGSPFSQGDQNFNGLDSSKKGQVWRCPKCSC